jgi:two-component system chemotaxis response regulator CheY
MMRLCPLAMQDTSRATLLQLIQSRSGLVHPSKDPSKSRPNALVRSHGEKGIQAIKSDDNALMVDMILCDMQMPKIDGVGAISYFLQQFPSVPVVVMTGHPDVNAATKLMKQGVKDYLVKPIEKEKLIAVVEDTVKQHVLFKDKFHA